MGLIERVAGSRIYIDTNVFIYAVEGFPLFATPLKHLFDAIDSGRMVAFTGELTLAELLVKPFADKNQEQIDAYQEMLGFSPGLTLVPISRSILVDSARFRAEFGMRTPDAIHAATAAACDCTSFISNDKRLTLPPSLKLVTLED